MTDMARSRIGIQWPNGGPGVITLYWTSGFPAGPIDATAVSDFHDELDSMIAGFVGVMPSDVSMIVEQEVAVITPETGAMTGVVIDPTARVGQAGTKSSAGTSRASQVCYNLLTDDFTGGRRLAGRHFWGPIASDAITTGGYISSTLYTGGNDFYAAIITGVGARLAVWHRPTSPTAADGRYADVTAIKVKPVPAVLRSRRN